MSRISDTMNLLLFQVYMLACRTRIYLVPKVKSEGIRESCRCIKRPGQEEDASSKESSFHLFDLF